MSTNTAEGNVCIQIPQGLLSPFARTDLANSERLVAMFGDRLRYVPNWHKWLAWDGQRWAVDAGRETECAKAVAKQVEHEIVASVTALNAGDTKKLVSFGEYTASAKGIRAMLDLARTASAISIDPAQLNQHPYLLNVQNGTIDLRTGEIQQHCREQLLTQFAPVEFDPAAPYPLWEATLRKILGDNANLLDFVQRLLGMSLLGTCDSEILPIFWGEGSNGKTLLIESVLAVVGSDYGIRCPDSLLLASRNEQHPTQLASLFGRRLAIVAETAAGRKLDESQVKALTGRDTISARRMREDFWTFTPTHQLILTTNHPPEVPFGGDAIWRRLRLVPFTVRFWDAAKGETGLPDLQADSSLPRRLRAEASGILNWLLIGCLNYQHSGLSQPAEVSAATAEYRDDQDVLRRWVEEALDLNTCCIGAVAFADLRGSYVEWCRDNNLQTFADRKLTAYLRQLPGVTYHRSNGSRYQGVAIRNRTRGASR